MNTTPKIHNPDNLTPEQYGAAQGWRLLYNGEDKAKDAEFYDIGGWFVANQCCPVATETTYRTRTPDPYASKTAADKAPDSGWIKMSERKPTEADLPVWVWDSNGKPAVVHSALMVMYDDTHWMPAKDLPAPPREMTQAERDREAFYGWVEVNPLSRRTDAFLAGIAYERAEIAKLVDDYRNSAELPGDLIQKLETRVKGTQ